MAEAIIGIRNFILVVIEFCFPPNILMMELKKAPAR
jgi:hypothetical protein